MEIIKIGSNSFKISLSDTEAKKYDITASSSSNEKLSESIKGLLDIAKRTEGIDFGQDRVATEIFLSKDGGCEIFVSRACVQNSTSRVKKETQALYRFEKIEYLLMACYRLTALSYKSRCSIYYNKSSKSYYLLINGIYPKDIKYAFLCEYGERLKNNLISYIDEYCDCISQNNTLENFAKLL